MSRPRVAMLAYACDPEGTGEHWLGWGWAEQAARSFEVHLFAPPKSRAAIERHSVVAGIVPHFVGLPPLLRAVSERLGSAGLWWRKLAWQRRAARAVAARHAQQAFAVVHQTTFHTFRVPFSAASLGIPAVWGPIAGGEETPPGFEEFLGSACVSEQRRRLANRLWLKLPSVQRSLRDAGAIFVSNQTTLAFLPESCRAKCEVVPPNALRAFEAASPRTRPAATSGLSLVYAGNCVATRAIPLVLHALARLGDRGVKLSIAGTGPALDDWRRDAQRLGVADRVDFLGQLPRERLVALYAAADVLAFPALRDAGGSAVLEAMSQGIPVLCLDWAGPAEMVDASSGVKIPVHDPAETIVQMAAALARLRDEPEWRASLGNRAAERAAALFTWEAKRHLLEATYARLIASA